MKDYLRDTRSMPLSPESQVSSLGQALACWYPLLLPPYPKVCSDVAVYILRCRTDTYVMRDVTDTNHQPPPAKAHTINSQLSLYYNWFLAPFILSLPQLSPYSCTDVKVIQWQKLTAEHLNNFNETSFRQRLPFIRWTQPKIALRITQHYVVEWARTRHTECDKRELEDIFVVFIYKQ